MKLSNTFITIRIDKKQLINQLRAMYDNHIELLIDTDNTNYITIKDRFNLNKMSTKN